MKKLSENQVEKWSEFLCNKDNKGHVERYLNSSDLKDHVYRCASSANLTAKRVRKDIGSLNPQCILEVGSSTGLNCFALRSIFPNAKIIGIDPEAEAISVAHSMNDHEAVEFHIAVGELIPLGDNSVDLIVCHTVIEHVNDVSKVISEFRRVLKVGGIVHLDAPNYIWPYEPHLKIWTIPLFGKRFVKFTAFFQGKSKMLYFIDHLKFVTPYVLEKLFLDNNLSYINRVQEKLELSISGEADIKRYKIAAKILFIMKYTGLSNVIVKILIKVGLYPSVMYTLKK